MNRIALAILVLSMTAFGSGSDTLLTEFSQLLKKGSPIQESKIAPLRHIMKAKDSSLIQKYFAAHLISLTSACTSAQETICPELEFLFQKRFEAGKIAGKKVVLDAARARGDFYLEKGKFKEAIESYEFLTLAPEAQHEYAVLKLGWAYVNNREAEKAFELWNEELSFLLKNDKSPSRNLVHGLGVSFTESTERKAQHVSALNDLSLSEEDTQTLIEGILEGIYFLRTKPMRLQWHESIKNLKLYPKVIQTLLVERFSPLNPNCDFIPLLSDEKVFSVFPSSRALLPVFNQCLLEFKKTNDDQLLKELTRLVENSDLKNANPYLAFNFLSTIAHQSTKACQLGIDWAFRESNPAKVALTEIATTCKNAENKEVVLQNLIDALSKKADSPERSRLQQTNASEIALLALVIDSPEFVTALTNETQEKPSQYRDTLVPILVAEQWAKSKGWSEILNYKNKLNISATSLEQKNVWNLSARSLLMEKIKNQDFSETQNLIRDLQLEEHLNTENLSLLLEWCRVFRREHSKEVKSTLIEITGHLKNALAHEQYTVFLELLLSEHLTSEFSMVVSKFGLTNTTKLHPSFDIVLLTSSTNRSLVIDAKGVKNSHYRKLIALSESLLRNEKVGSKYWEIDSKSPLHDNFKFLNNLSRQDELARREKNSSLNKISHWVDFLQLIARLNKKTWVANILEEYALGRASDTLQFIAENYSKLPPNPDLSTQEWSQILSTLESKISESKKLLAELFSRTSRRQAE